MDKVETMPSSRLRKSSVKSLQEVSFSFQVFGRELFGGGGAGLGRTRSFLLASTRLFQTGGANAE
jgi:hypothetical protein